MNVANDAPAAPVTQDYFALRIFLAIDAAILLLLGIAFVSAPAQVLEVFQFHDFPRGVEYMIGLWGCVYLTLCWGYLMAAGDPIRNILWVQVGIARGALECILGIACVLRDIVTLRQAALGIVVAGCLAIVYLVLYPRPIMAVPPSSEAGTATEDTQNG